MTRHDYQLTPEEEREFALVSAARDDVSDDEYAQLLARAREDGSIRGVLCG